MPANEASKTVRDFSHALLRLIREGFDGIDARQSDQGDHVSVVVDFKDGRVFTIDVRGSQERNPGLPKP